MLDGARAVGLEDGARVLEVGAGTGQLTAALVDAGFDVVALEPGAALRARASERVPAAQLVGETFEAFAPRARFAAIFSSNAFHWIDPAASYVKAAEMGDALVLLWSRLLVTDVELDRRVHDVFGESAPDARSVRAAFEEDAAAGREELAASGLFAAPWWRFRERSLAYTRERYVSFVRTMGAFAAQPEKVRHELASALRAALPAEPFEVAEILYVVAAKRR